MTLAHPIKRVPGILIDVGSATVSITNGSDLLVLKLLGARTGRPPTDLSGQVHRRAQARLDRHLVVPV